MAFVFETTLEEARAAGIAINHIVAAEKALNAMEEVKYEDIRDNNAPHREAFKKYDRLSICREALVHLSALCGTRNEPKLSKDLEFSHHIKVDLPFLSTDFQQERTAFEKRLATTKAKYFEQAKLIDFTAKDQQVATLNDVLEAESQRIDQKILGKSKIDISSVQYLQLLSSGLNPIKYQDALVRDQEMAPTKLVSRLVPGREDGFVTMDDNMESAKDNDTNLGNTLLSLHEPFETDDKRRLPGSSRENPIDVDTLETVFARRCSMTPDVDNGDVPLKRRLRQKKLASPLTPPNTVRLHRRRASTKTGSLLQDMAVDSLCQARSPNSKDVTSPNMERQFYAQGIVQDSIAKEPIRPRQTPQKIRLPKLAAASRFSDQPVKWDYRKLRQFRAALHDHYQHQGHILKDHNLPSVPWAPYSYDPERFQSNFGLLRVEDSSFDIATSMNLRQQVSIPKVADSPEELEEVSCSHVEQIPVEEQLRSILGKRNHEVMQQQPQQQRYSTRDAVGLETFFSDIGFHLMTKKRTKFGDLGD